MDGDRRQFPRHPVRMGVRVHAGGRKFRATTINVSPTAGFIATPKPPARGHAVAIEFRPGTGDSGVMVYGIVDRLAFAGTAAEPGFVARWTAAQVRNDDQRLMRFLRDVLGVVDVALVSQPQRRGVVHVFEGGTLPPPLISDSGRHHSAGRRGRGTAVISDEIVPPPIRAPERSPHRTSGRSAARRFTSSTPPATARVRPPDRMMRSVDVVDAPAPAPSNPLSVGGPDAAILPPASAAQRDAMSQRVSLTPDEYALEMDVLGAFREAPRPQDRVGASRVVNGPKRKPTPAPTGQPTPASPFDSPKFRVSSPLEPVAAQAPRLQPMEPTPAAEERTVDNPARHADTVDTLNDAPESEPERKGNGVARMGRKLLSLTGRLLKRDQESVTYGTELVSPDGWFYRPETDGPLAARPTDANGQSLRRDPVRTTAPPPRKPRRARTTGARAETNPMRGAGAPGITGANRARELGELAEIDVPCSYLLGHRFHGGRLTGCNERALVVLAESIELPERDGRIEVNVPLYIEGKYRSFTVHGLVLNDPSLRGDAFEFMVWIKTFVEFGQRDSWATFLAQEAPKATEDEAADELPQAGSKRSPRADSSATALKREALGRAKKPSSGWQQSRVQRRPLANSRVTPPRRMSSGL